MAPNLNFRNATPEDALEMQAIHKAASHNPVLHERCFPSDPASVSGHLEWVKRQLPEATLACDEAGKIVGWVRWVPRPHQTPPRPRVVLTTDMYPATGDPEFAVKFFQTNVDKSEEVCKKENVYILAVLVVRPEEQRKGIGSALIAPWIEKADEEGWSCFTNASEFGKGLYKKFDFVTTDVSWFAEGLETHHMKREARKPKN